jgi:hypothetical protein
MVLVKRSSSKIVYIEEIGTNSIHFASDRLNCLKMEPANHVKMRLRCRYNRHGMQASTSRVYSNNCCDIDNRKNNDKIKG